MTQVEPLGGGIRPTTVCSEAMNPLKIIVKSSARLAAGDLSARMVCLLPEVTSAGPLAPSMRWQNAWRAAKWRGRSRSTR